jgi:hypothetical protein
MPLVYPGGKFDTCGVSSCFQTGPRYLMSHNKSDVAAGGKFLRVSVGRIGKGRNRNWM